MRRPVAVTGIGVLAPNGVGRAAYWAALAGGETGIRTITLFDPAPFPCRVAGEVPGSDWLDCLGRKEARRLARFNQLALVAARLAAEDARLPSGRLAGGDAGILVGVCTSALDLIEREHRRFLRRGYAAVSPHGIFAAAPNAAAVSIASFLECPGFRQTVANDCTSGLEAVGLAYEKIARGSLTLAFCGGVDAPLTPLLWGGYCQSGLVPVDGTVDATSSCPFDRRRTVGIISEGAAILVLEDMALARARGATLYGEIIGYDSHSRVGDAAGGLARVMRGALAAAGTAPDEVEYLSAHAPSHQELDAAEAAALGDVFGARSASLPVTSIKSMIGNPFTAAGPLQLAGVLQAFRESVLAPTINYREPDPGCALDCVPNRARLNRVTRVMVNSHGMGGGNVSLVLGKCPR